MATYEALGLAPEERGVALAFLARQLYSQTTGNTPSAVTSRSLPSILPATTGAEATATEASEPVTIAAPLTADHWRDLLQLRGKTDLFPALVSNRSVLLVCAGALMTDPSVRTLLERDRGLLRWLARTAPAGFWIAARSLRIQDGRVQVPGGPAFDRLWESMVGVAVTKPADFIRALSSRDGARLAWFYDSIATMPPSRMQAAFGNAPVEAQLQRAQEMYAAFRSGDQNWRLEQHPFLRGIADPWIVTTQIAIDEDGIVAQPHWQWLWEEVFERPDLTRRDATSHRRSPGTAVTLAWLGQRIASAPPRERRARYEMVRFAQGVFGAATEGDGVDLLVALGGYRRYRGALIALDRMGVTSPHAYARIVEAARRAHENSSREQRYGIVSFQAALAIIERARLVNALDTAAAERLVLSLADAVDRDAPTMPAVTRWMTSTLMEALPPLVQPDQWTGQTAYESRILQAMAGSQETDLPTIEWENLRYRIDLAAFERERLRGIREQLESPGLDAALASAQPRQIADALTVLIYTPALGDPNGQAMLGADIATRHDFGFDAPAGARRAELAWALPHDQVGSGGPWHVEGALVGLDIGLARLALRRISDNDMPIAPSINLNDQLTLSRTIPTLNPRDLRDDSRDRIVAAIARGRRRVADAGTDLAALTVLATETRMTAAERQTLPWLLARAPELPRQLFGLRDFLWLGKPDLPRDELDRWGVYGEPLNGRARTVMPEAQPWEDFTGRAEGGFMGTQSPDLVLRMAEETARLKLPSRLIPSLLMYATQDYWHDVAARFADDRPAMARQALALSPSRVEDYVAALAGGPLRPQ